MNLFAIQYLQILTIDNEDQVVFQIFDWYICREVVFYFLKKIVIMLFVI